MSTVTRSCPEGDQHEPQPRRGRQHRDPAGRPEPPEQPRTRHDSAQTEASGTSGHVIRSLGGVHGQIIARRQPANRVRRPLTSRVTVRTTRAGSPGSCEDGSPSRARSSQAESSRLRDDASPSRTRGLAISKPLDGGGKEKMCQHQPRCPGWPAPDHLAARIVADQPGQGWSLLCNGVILFDDGGELLPDGRAGHP